METSRFRALKIRIQSDVEIRTLFSLVLGLILAGGAFAQDASRDAYNKGISKLNAGDTDGAIAAFDEAIQLNSKFVEAYAMRGNAKNQKGDLDGAIAEYTKAIEINPRYDLAYVNRAIVRDRKNDLDGAISDADAAIALDPKRAASYKARGIAKEEKGDFDGAIADLNECVKIDPKIDAGLGLLALSTAKELKGDLDGALSDLARCLQVIPTGHDQDEIHIRMWVIRAKQGHAGEANQELSAYINNRFDMVPGDWPSKITAFLIDTSSQNAFLASARVENPETTRTRLSDAWYFCGIKYLLAGNKDSAAYCFKKCLAAAHNTFSDNCLLAKGELKNLGGTD